MAGNQGLHSAENGKLGGRPKNASTLAAQKFKDALATRMMDESKKWLDAIEDTALGHFVEVKGPDGEVKVYKKSPDPNAWQKATDRAFGKPEQQLEIDAHVENVQSIREDIARVANQITLSYANNSGTSEDTLQGRDGEAANLDSESVRDIRRDLRKAVEEITY